MMMYSMIFHHLFRSMTVEISQVLNLEKRKQALLSSLVVMMMVTMLMKKKKEQEEEEKNEEEVEKETVHVFVFQEVSLELL